MTEYHRDNKRFIRENCISCVGCDGIVVFIGQDLIDSGAMPDAIPNKFYFADKCPDYRANTITEDMEEEE